MELRQGCVLSQGSRCGKEKSREAEKAPDAHALIKQGAGEPAPRGIQLLMEQSKENISGRVRKRRVQSGLVNHSQTLAITIIEPTSAGCGKA